MRPDIINRIKEGSITAYYNSNVIEILENEIVLDTLEGIVRLENDFVLALTGYMPNFEFLEQLGIHLSKDEKKLPHYNSDTMETNIEGLFLAGVICGGMETHKWFIENSRIHAQIIVSAILEKMQLAHKT